MSWKEQMTDALNLPKDLMLGAVIMTITGKHEAYVENYMSLIEYTEELIRIQTKIGQIRITGKNLRVDYYTNDDMKLTGQIEAIEYQQ